MIIITSSLSSSSLSPSSLSGVALGHVNYIIVGFLTFENHDRVYHFLHHYVSELANRIKPKDKADDDDDDSKKDYPRYEILS